MTRFLAIALAALCLLAPAHAVRAADKPLVMEAGQVKQLPTATALQLQAATTANASANLPQGTAPTSPADGDLWSTTLGVFGRNGGVTRGPFNSGTVTSVTCGSPLTGGTFTTTGTCSISANALALGKIAQIGGNSYLGNTSSSTGDVTAYTLPACTASNQAYHYTLGSGFSCASISGVSGGTNPFFIGTPDISSGCGSPSVTADPIGSLYMDQCAAALWQQVAASTTVPLLVQDTSFNGVSGTLGAVPTPGDFLVGVCTVYGTPVVNTGWTQAYSVGAAVFSPGLTIAYQQVVSGATTAVQPCTSAGGSTVVYEISGIANWTDSYLTTVGAYNDGPLNYATLTSDNLALATFGAHNNSTDPGAGSITAGNVTGAQTTAHTGTVSILGAATAFSASSSSVTVTAGFASGPAGGTGALTMFKPSSVGWRRIGTLVTLKSLGTTITTAPISINFSTGLSASDDGLGNTTVVATGPTISGSPASGNLAKFSGASSITNGDLSGDCTTSGTLAITCTKSSGTLLTSIFLQIANNLSDLASASTARTNLGLGTFATANAATPPAIGGTTPAAGTFSSLKATNVTGATQCLHADTTGAITGTGSDCGAGGGGGGTGTVTSVTCGGNTITVSGTCMGGSLTPQGRLTLVSATPVMTSDQTAKSTVYYDCFAGKYVPFYDGATDQLDSIGACEVSLTMQTSGTGVTNSGGVFDIWWSPANDNICVATNGSGGGWASDTGGSNTARGTGYSQVHNTRGYWTNVNAITHCYNGATDYGSLSADQATYLGTLYTTAAGQTGMAYSPAAASGGVNAVLGLWNAHYRVQVAAKNRDSAVSWTYNSTTWRASNGSASNRVSYVDGLGQSTVLGTFVQGINGTTGAANIGLNRDSTSADPAVTMQVNGTAGNGVVPATVADNLAPLAGFHFITEMEATSGATLTYDGSGTSPNRQMNALRVSLEM